ncbi:hypothetical protein J6590_040304 [Homalodisca vitripennis]|nr:hypothetical protein J6590_040304 [Homalodisca vitripennis]
MGKQKKSGSRYSAFKVRKNFGKPKPKSRPTEVTDPFTTESKSSTSKSNLQPNLAVPSYNDGYFSKVKVMKELGLSAGVNLAKAMKRLDEELKAEKALLEFDKKCGNQEL